MIIDTTQNKIEHSMETSRQKQDMDYVFADYRYLFPADVSIINRVFGLPGINEVIEEDFFDWKIFNGAKAVSLAYSLTTRPGYMQGFFDKIDGWWLSPVRDFGFRVKNKNTEYATTVYATTVYATTVYRYYGLKYGQIYNVSGVNSEGNRIWRIGKTIDGVSDSFQDIAVYENY